MRIQQFLTLPSIVGWLLLLLCVLPSVAWTACPAVLSEASPLGTPPHSAQAMVQQQSTCPPIKKVSANLYVDDEIQVSRSFYDEAISNPPLRFPVAELRSLPDVAGLYRIEWLTEFIDGSTQTFVQTFAIPCPAPAAVTPIWSDVDSILRFVAPPGDRCEGETVSTLSLASATGEVVIPSQALSYRVDDGHTADVKMELPQLAGERRYVGVLSLTNESNLSTEVPVEFVTGCGELTPNATVSGNRMIGGVTASDCQFPINMEIDVQHESGESVQTVHAILMEPTFDFELPEFSTWPAGNYTIETQFIGAASRARLSNNVQIACSDPELSNPTIELDASGNGAEVVFSLQNRDVCQKETQVAVQVRDNDRVVTFNRSLDLPSSGTAQEFRWPFLGVPGSSYHLDLTARYGLNGEREVKRTSRGTYECVQPKALEFGYSTPEATHLTALVALASCNTPATAKIAVYNDRGRVVAEGDPQIQQDDGSAFARIAPVSLGHLDSGSYRATLTLADNRARTATDEITITRDTDGPEIQFYHDGIAVTDGEISVVSALDELGLRFVDANPLLPSFQLFSERVAGGDPSSTVTILRVDGESTSQMWLTGLVDVPRTDAGWGFVGVLARDPAGNHWLAPISRTFVPTGPAQTADFHPSRSRLGFRSVARVQDLQPGRYEIVGVLLSVDAERRLVPATAAFTVSSLSAQQHDAILRQGVTEIPVALEWNTDGSASFARVTSVPDGDYTLSAIGRDTYGNASNVFSAVVRLNQSKSRASLDWPAIANYRKSFTHQFRSSATGPAGPLRVLYRRVDGFGAVRVNGRNISEQSTEDVLRPDANGNYQVNVEILDADIDTRVVLHADATDAEPLELMIRTFRPIFVTQRTRSETVDTLSISHSEQPCRRVVFDDLAQVSLRADEVLCAVRLNIPGTSVISTTSERTDVRLPMGISTDALYEEGFVRVSNGVPIFQPTRQIPVKDMQAYSLTPQVEFVPLQQWRARAAAGNYLTGVGEAIAGHFVFRPGLSTPVVTIDDEPVELPENITGNIRIPVTTNIARLGQKTSVRLRAHYADSPDLSVTRQLQFVAAPKALFIEAIDGQFVAPASLGLTLELRDVSGLFDPSLHGTHELVSAALTSRHGTPAALPEPSVTLSPNGRLDVELGSLEPGPYRLSLALRNTDPRFAPYLKVIETDATFEILDGTPIKAALFTFRDTDKTPFFGQISVDYAKESRRRDVGRIAWQISNDGATFELLKCCGHSVDFAVAEPGSKLYRAELTNRHSGETSFTEPIKITAYPSGSLRVVGPRYTFRGIPAEYSVEGLPSDYDVLWRVTSPNATQAMEVRGPTLTVPADETGTYDIEVVADTATDDSDSVAALRTFFTLEASWPRLPESVIAGPTKVEFGKVSTFTVTHPPIFKSRGNPAVRRTGEWELPDGTRVQDDEWTQFTLRSLPEGYTAANILYHTWLEGDPTTLTTAVHRVEPVTYRWPNWKLNVATNSMEPPAILRLSVAPDEWTDWMGLGDSPISTHWDLPDYIRVLDRTPTEAIIVAMDDREFDVTARVTDPRGNVTELSERGIRPLKQIPFEIALSAVAERSLHTAPLNITAQVDPIVLPKDRQINRVAFYVNGLYRGVSDGSPMELQLRTPGEHTLRAIASIGNEFTADDTITLTIGENHKATCTIAAVGDFRRNGLAKAQCDDPDGHMVEYRWYANGQLLSDSGTRVQLSRAARLGLTELSLIAVDNAGVETAARYLPPSDQ